MGDDTKAEVLKLLGQMKREAGKTPCIHLDQLAVGIITNDIRPLVMVQGLRDWMGISADAQ